MKNNKSTMPGEDLYPSRIGGTEQIIQRKDPIVYGDTQPDVVHTFATALDIAHACKQAGK